MTYVSGPAANIVYEHLEEERTLADLLRLAEKKSEKTLKLLTALHIARIKDMGQPVPEHLLKKEA